MKKKEEEIKSPDGNSNTYGIESMYLKPINKAFPASTSMNQIKPFDDGSTKEETNITSFSGGSTVIITGNNIISGNIGEGQEIKTVSFSSANALTIGSNVTGNIGEGEKAIGTVSFSNDSKLSIHCSNCGKKCSHTFIESLKGYNRISDYYTCDCCGERFTNDRFFN